MLVTCLPDTSVSEITYLGVTLTFSPAVEFGYFETDGSPWFIGPANFPTMSPVWEGSGDRHGAMINPSQTALQGFDNRYIQGASYDASLNVQKNPPTTISPGQTICKAISKDPETSSIGTGGDATTIEYMAVFTCLSEAPASGAFRPPYAGSDKTMRNRSEVNHSLSPGLTKPTGPISGQGTLDMSTVMTKPLYDVGTRTSRHKTRPRVNFGGSVYPATVFTQVANPAVYSLLNQPDADEVRNRLVQHGLDYWAISQFCDDSFADGAGFGANGALFLILYAGYFLEDATMLAEGDSTTTTGRPKYGEQYQYHYTSDPDPALVLPKPVASYSGNVPLFGDYQDGATPTVGSNWSERALSYQAAEIAAENQVGYRDTANFGVSTSYYPAPPLFRGESAYTSDPAGTYMYIAGQGHQGILFVAKKLGIDGYFNADACFDWLERAIADPVNMCSYNGRRNTNIYVYGGNASSIYKHFMENMHLNYHGTRATLSGQSAVATGPTTATLTVTTNLGSGRLHAVVTTSATKPKGTLVRSGCTHVENTLAIASASSGFLTTTGVKTLDLTGLTTGVAQYIHVTQYGEDASIASVVTAGPITPS